VSLDRVGTDVAEVASDWLDLPFERIAAAWVIGGWWRPQLEIRTRSIEDLEDVPAARGITLRLRIHRRDRRLALAIAAEIEARFQAEEDY
jgi:hypothetical protein